MRTSILPVVLSPAYPPIEAMIAPDGTQGAAARSLCRMIGIDFSAQLQRIKRQQNLAAALQYVTVDTGGGVKPVAMLASYAIALWASSLQTSRIAPERQEAVILLQQQAYTAIQKAFDNQTSLPNAAELQSPPPPASGLAATDPFALLHAAVDMLQKHHTAIEQRLIYLETQRTPQTNAGLLTGPMLQQMYLRLRLLRDRIGLPIEEAEQQLAQQFGVRHPSDVPAQDYSRLLSAIDQLL